MYPNAKHIKASVTVRVRMAWELQRVQACSPTPSSRRNSRKQQIGLDIRAGSYYILLYSNSIRTNAPMTYPGPALQQFLRPFQSRLGRMPASIRDPSTRTYCLPTTMSSHTMKQAWQADIEKHWVHRLHRLEAATWQEWFRFCKLLSFHLTNSDGSGRSLTWTHMGISIAFVQQCRCPHHTIKSFAHSLFLLSSTYFQTLEAHRILYKLCW